MSGQSQEYDNLAVSFDFSGLGHPPRYTDCTIKIGSEEIPSHRVILAGSSPVLAEKLSDDSITTLDLSDFAVDSFRLFLGLVYNRNLKLSQESLPGLLKIAYDLSIKALFDICSEFIDQISSVRTVLKLLSTIGFAMNRLPNFLQFAAALIEAVSSDTDFAFLPPNEFRLLISHARFTSNYVRDDLIRKYLEATHSDPARFAEFAESSIGAVDDQIQRTAYSAVFICSPPDPGLLRSLSSQIKVVSSGMLNGRDPSSIIEEKPKKHWFTESDGNAWVLLEFTELFIQPTDYAIWSHAGASTLRNWVFQGSNDRINWVVLSTHRNDESIKQPFSTATWPINTNGFFKFFRVVQTGNNWSGNSWLYMLKLEIWGVACSMDM
jgi:hypothetical protein